MSARPTIKALAVGRFLALGVILLATHQIAHAEVEQPARPRPPDDGVWIQITAVKQTKPVNVSVQIGQLGGSRINYVAVQLERAVAPQVMVSAAYARGRLQIDNGPDLPLNLVRLGATWSSGSRPVELDARLWGELLIPDRGSVTRQARLRLRVTADLPNVLPAINPRLFVANEVFVTTADGFTRNRASVGVRTRPAKSLFVDVAYQRTDDTNGNDQNAAVLQLIRFF